MGLFFQATRSICWPVCAVLGAVAGIDSIRLIAASACVSSPFLSVRTDSAFLSWASCMLVPRLTSDSVEPLMESIVCFLTRDQKPYLSALVAIDPDVTFSEEEIQTRVERQIAEGNKKLAPFEQIKKYKILPESPSVENGFRTPTQKIRRKALIQKYEDLF